MMTFSSFLLWSFLFFSRPCHLSDASGFWCLFFFFFFFFSSKYYSNTDDSGRFLGYLSGAAGLLLYYPIYIPSLPIHPIILAQL